MHVVHYLLEKVQIYVETDFCARRVLAALSDHFRDQSILSRNFELVVLSRVYKNRASCNNKGMVSTD